jgi:hypothetical protein
MRKISLVLILSLVFVWTLSAQMSHKHAGLIGSEQFRDPSRTWVLAQMQYDEMLTGSSLWDPAEKYQYFYNPYYSLRVDSIWCNYSVPYSTVFTHDYTIVYSYTVDNEHISNITSYYANRSTPYFKYNITYDAQNRLSGYQRYDYYGGSWLQNEFLVVTYQTSNAFQYDFTYYNESGTVTFYERVNFAVDAQGRITTETWQYSDDQSIWSNLDKYTYAYNALDTTTAATLANTFAHQFVPMMALNQVSENWEWISYGKFSEEYYYSWDTSWSPVEKSLFIYNTSGQLETMNLYDWLAAWTISSRRNYSYNSAGNMYLDLIQDWGGTQNPVWEDSARYLYTWQADSAADEYLLPSIPVLRISLAPNPFSTQIALKADTKQNLPVEWTIFNLKGAILFRTEAPAGSSITWQPEQQTAGIYLIKAKQGSVSTLRKCIKLN